VFAGRLFYAKGRNKAKPSWFDSIAKGNSICYFVADVFGRKLPNRQIPYIVTKKWAKLAIVIGCRA